MSIYFFFTSSFLYSDVCFSTTCGYQILKNKSLPSDSLRIIKLLQYKALNGLGLALELEDGLVHHFMGSLFTHQTCQFVGTLSDKRITFNNDTDSCTMLAWGEGGGDKEARARRELYLRLAAGWVEPERPPRVTENMYQDIQQHQATFSQEEHGLVADFEAGRAALRPADRAARRGAARQGAAR